MGGLGLICDEAFDPVEDREGDELRAARASWLRREP